MKDVEFTKLSAKGQVVIPLDIREGLQLVPGTPFAVIARKDTIMLKKIDMPKIKSWDEIAKPFRDAARKSGLTKKDLDELLAKVRAAK